MPLESDLESGQPWQFDEAVAERFDDMLERSIPEYETMRELTTLVASAFLRPGTIVLDLGCARGEALARIAELPGTEEVGFVGLEVSKPMHDAATERFASDDRVEVLLRDLREGLPPIEYPCSVVLSVLTLMFVPTNYRGRILEGVHRALRPGGALVLVEKVLGPSSSIDDLFAANYHRRKAETGYTPDEIQRKRLALEGVLVPNTSAINRTLLEAAGFREIDCFWRWFNFEGTVAVR